MEQVKDRGKVQAVPKAVRVAAGEMLPGRVRVDFAFAPTAVNKQPINLEVPVMNKNVPSAKRP